MFPRTWHSSLGKEALARLVDVERAVAIELRQYEVYPPRNLMYRALELVHPMDVKIVIVGQDPYFRPAQAMGLSFSVPKHVVVPVSLRNIFRELERDLRIPLPTHGNLTPWAKQGVLLLNMALSVRSGEPNSHSAIWRETTNEIIKRVGSTIAKPTVFLLWGRRAQAVELHIAKHHEVLKCAHPAARNGKFHGNRHFSKANEFLQKHGRGNIAWELP